MSVKLIIGRSSSSKSSLLYKEIMACEKNGKHVLLFVPATARVNSEKEYIRFTGKKGIIDTYITTIDRFVDKNIDKSKLYENKEFLPEISKKLLIQKVINENKGMFKIFSKVKDTQGFVDKVYNYTNSFEDIDIDVEKLKDKYPDNDFLREKLLEIVSIYTKVRELLRDRFVTSKELINIYVEGMKEKSLELSGLENVSVFFDGYNNYTKQEYSFIEELIKSGIDVTFNIDLELDENTNVKSDIFNVPFDTFKKIKKIAANEKEKVEVICIEDSDTAVKPDIKFLAGNIFNMTRKKYSEGSNNVNLTLFSNPYEEIEYIAKDILKEIEVNKLRYKDFNVYTSDFDMYKTGIKEVFTKYNIQYNMSFASNINNNNLVIYLTNILDLVQNGFPYANQTSVVNLLKTNLLDISEEEIYVFENYILEFGIKGYMFENEFKYNNKEENGAKVIYDLDGINKVRTCIVGQVANLREKLGIARTAKDITQVIYDHLIDEKIIQRYEKCTKDTLDYSAEVYDKQSQVVKKIYEVMDAICLVYDDVKLEEYILALKYALGDESVSAIPSYIDEVQICDINKNRELTCKNVYIIGAYDSGLPKVHSEDNIFSDREIELLKQKQIEIKDDSKSKNEKELFNIYQAISKCSDKLTVTVPASKMTGTSLRPSPVIQDIKNVLDVKLKSYDELEKGNIKLKQEAFEELSFYLTDEFYLSSVSDEDKIKEMQALFSYFSCSDEKDDSSYEKVLDYSRRDDNLSSSTLDMIYKTDLKSSVSRLEQFERCPFAYYAKYILKLNEKKEYEITSIDMGNIMHLILERYSRFLVERDILWSDVSSSDELKEKTKKIINQMIEELFGDKYQKHSKSVRLNAMKSKIKKSIYNVVVSISESFSQSAFRPLGYEVEFDEGKLFAPIEIVLENGKKMYLRGKIDRIDTCKIKEDIYVRIVDYKSSDKKLDLNSIKEGISLQLMAYMSAIVENKQKFGSTARVIPAALNYYTLNSKVLNLTNYEEDTSKIKSQIRKALKLKGIYISDVDVLKNIDREYENSNNSYIDISSRNMNNKNKVLSEDVFKEECTNIKETLRKIGEEIVRGKVKICPNKKVKEVCKYCSYNSFCRKNIKN